MRVAQRCRSRVTRAMLHDAEQDASGSDGAAQRIVVPVPWGRLARARAFPATIGTMPILPRRASRNGPGSPAKGLRITALGRAALRRDCLHRSGQTGGRPEPARPRRRHRPLAGHDRTARDRCHPRGRGPAAEHPRARGAEARGAGRVRSGGLPSASRCLEGQRRSALPESSGRSASRGPAGIPWGQPPARQAARHRVVPPSASTWPTAPPPWPAVRSPDRQR
jgi:hypothetical protein